jgi:hypothetical protein
MSLRSSGLRLLGFLVIASDAKQSIIRQAKKEWIASSRSLSSGAHSRDPLAPLRKRFAFVAGNDVGHKSAISPHAREFYPEHPALSKIRGRRECRAPDAPAASRVEKNTRVSHHGHTGKRPAFPAQWF